MKNSVKDRVFVVTGAGSGMGREIVLELLKREANVAAVDINPDTLKETFDLANVSEERLSLHVLDVSDKEKVYELPKDVINHHNKVDGLINNAGIIQPFVHFMDLDDNVIEKVFKINLFGLLYLTKAFIPHLSTSSNANLVNVSSMGGFLPVPGQGIYGASKAAVKLFTEALYAELLDTNINVSVVFPGAVATNISNNSALMHNKKNDQQQDDGSSHKITSAYDAAQIIINGIEKNKLRIFVGNDSKMMDRLYRLAPKKAINLMAKMIKKMMK